jgi:hypothetical protein
MLRPGYLPVAYVDAGERLTKSNQSTLLAKNMIAAGRSLRQALVLPAACTAPFRRHEPVALGRGVATAGNPAAWLVAGGRRSHCHGARAAAVARP